MKFFTAAISVVLLVLSARSALVHGATTFITNGQNETGAIPFYGYLEIFRVNTVYFGGSALISRTAVVTVAQNVVGFSAWRVGFGGKRIRELIWHSVDRAIPHTGYNAELLLNNIAVLILNNPITISSVIAPIAITPNGANFPMPQTIGSVVGFGFGQVNAQPEVLQTTTFRVTTQADCSSAYPHLAQHNHLQLYFCAANPTAFSNICAGDQGGPIFSPQLQILFGIASFIRTENCNDVNSSPAAFIRLSEHFEFLQCHLDNPPPACV